MKLENVMKKTALSIAGLAMLAGLSSCGPLYVKPYNTRCPEEYNYDKNCKRISGEYVCQPRCVYSPAVKPNTRDFGGANEGPGALDRR